LCSCLRRRDGGYSLIWLDIWNDRSLCRLRHQRHGVFIDFIAEFEFEFLHHVALQRGDFHGRFVAFHGDQALLGLDGVARFLSPPTVTASALARELLSFAALRARVAAQTD
jgi:hypothetical protein